MNPRLTSRLTIPFACLSFLLLFIAGVSAWHVRQLQASMSELLGSNVVSVLAAQELEISIREVRSQFDRYLITGDRKYLEPVARLKQRVSDALADADAAAGTSKEQGLMKRIREGHDHFFREYDQLIREPPVHTLYPKIIDLIDGVLTREILEPAHEYLRLNEGALSRTNEENRHLSERLTLGLLGLGICGSAGGILGGFFMAGALRRSLLKTEEGLWWTASQLQQAAGRGLVLARPGKNGDALEQVRLSASAVLYRLEQTERDALHAEQLAWIGQMAAGIAHEIRNPLMAIKLLVQAVAERRSANFTPRDLRVLEEEIIRLEQIVSGFLDFARPPRLDLRLMDVQPIITQTVHSVRARADLQRVNLHLEPTAGALVVRGDPNQFRQIIFNLLFNALDALPRGGEVWIRISRVSREEKEEAVIEVEDSGEGLPAELGSRIFEPFVSTKETGIGLGLSICRRIAEAHGGTLQAGEGAAGGALFTLTMPVPMDEKQD